MKTRFFRINKRIDKCMEREFLMFLKHLNPENTSYLFLMFDTYGGQLKSAINMITAMGGSKVKFIGIAYGKIDSAAIPIYLSCQSWFSYDECSSHIHRAKKNVNLVSNNFLKKAERQIFSMISDRLQIPMREVYALADAETTITPQHPLGKKFFMNT